MDSAQKVIALVIAACGIIARPAFAQEAKPIDVAPVFVEIAFADADREKNLEFNIINNSGNTVELELQPIDFSQADLSRVEAYAIAAYVQPERQELLLFPGAEEKLKVTVENRDELPPGIHYAALLVVPAESELSSAIAVLQINKTGGARYNLSLVDVSWPDAAVVFGFPSGLLLQFQNEGNIKLVPGGEVAIRDALTGKQLYQGTVNEREIPVQPSARQYIDVGLKRQEDNLPFSLQVMEISGQDLQEKTRFLYSDTYLYISPKVLPVLGLIVVGLWLLRKIRKPYLRYKRVNIGES